MDKIINKYLIFGFLKIVGNVILVFICLGIILNLFEEIEFFKDNFRVIAPDIFNNIIHTEFNYKITSIHYFYFCYVVFNFT